MSTKPKQPQTDREIEDALLVFGALIILAAFAISALLAGLSMIFKAAL